MSIHGPVFNIIHHFRIYPDFYISNVCRFKGIELFVFHILQCSRSKFLSKILKILVKNFPEIFPEFFFYSFANFNEKNSNLIALNDGGAIKGMDAREDGVYITYVPTAGADAVTKKCSGVDKYNNVSGVRVSWREIYFNIAALRDDYQALSLDSICVQLLKISPNGQENPVFNYSYNASTGRLTITTVSDMFGVITGMVANIWVSP